MDTLWDGDAPITANELRDKLAAGRGGDKTPALTTVLTVLSRLEAKGFVDRDREARPHLYFAALSRGARVDVSDRSPRRGERVTVTGSRFAGDRQVRVQLGDADLGALDLVNGTAWTTWRAERGTTTLTFTGVQTGKVATAHVRVR